MRRSFFLFAATASVIGLIDTVGMRQVHGQETAGEMLRRAAEFAEQGQSRQAAEAATQAIELQPDLADAYYLRGREHFRLGEVEKSVADFEKLVQLRPRRAASLWELGISYYYAG